MQRIVKRNKIVWNFTCPTCKSSWRYDPEDKGQQNKYMNLWADLGRVISVPRTGGLVLKFRELLCLRCGSIFVKLHEDTNMVVADKWKELKMRKDVIQSTEMVDDAIQGTQDKGTPTLKDEAKKDPEVEPEPVKAADKTAKKAGRPRKEG